VREECAGSVQESKDLREAQTVSGKCKTECILEYAK
jgi:hypothetical protein